MGEVRSPRDWLTVFATVAPTVGSLLLVWWNLVVQISALEKRMSVFEAVKGPMDQISEIRFKGIEDRLGEVELRVQTLEQHTLYWGKDGINERGK